MRQVLLGHQSEIWTAIPGYINTVNLSNMTCTVQPTVIVNVADPNGNAIPTKLPLLLDVPIVFPCGGGFMVSFPVAVNDEVLVIFASRCIDGWWQSGGAQKESEFRFHDLSDGFAIPGPRSVPNVPTSISSTDLQVRNKAGTVYLSLTSGGKFKMVNPTTNLTAVLTNLESALNVFMGVLAGFSGGTAAVTQTMLQTPATACQTSLAAVLTEIGALLS